jgi:NADH-quinone oxidoreductase subunit J
MENFVYYLFCAMCVGGALGVIVLRDFVNSAMSMLVSMLGVAGLMLLMNAYFPAFIMITVYAGAVMVLFVFVVMLVGDKKVERRWGKQIALVFLWIALCVWLAFLLQSLLQILIIWYKLMLLH